jgi:hypothetical protein
MSLHRTASLSVSLLLSLTAALAEEKSAPNPPAFTPEEVALINRDPRLVYAARACPWQLRRTLDAWDRIRSGVDPSPVPSEPCGQSDDDMGRASDEAALDILKILKEAAGQGTKR